MSPRGGGSVTLSVSQGDGCTLLGPAAPPALSEEPAAPDTDTGSHTDRPNTTRRRGQTRPDGAVTPSQGGDDGERGERTLDLHLLTWTNTPQRCEEN